MDKKLILKDHAEGMGINALSKKYKMKKDKIKSILDEEETKSEEVKTYTEVIQKYNVIQEVPDLKDNDVVIQKYNKSITTENLEELVNMLEPLRHIINEYNKSKTIVEVDTIELRPKAVSDVKQKLFKVDADILAKWEVFVSKNKEYKVQQLVSLALEEFIKKYDK